MPPHKQRKAVPCESRSTHRVNRDDKIQARENRREARNEYTQGGHDHVCVRIRGAKRSIERPACIDTTLHYRRKRNNAAHDVEIPTQQVDPRKSEIPGSNHHRD